MEETFQKSIVLTTDEGVVVYDYTPNSYVIKTSKEWMAIPLNSDKIKVKLSNPKYNPNLTDQDGKIIKGWVLGKKKNTIKIITDALK